VLVLSELSDENTLHLALEDLAHGDEVELVT